MDSEQPAITEVTWQQVRTSVQKSCPDLAAIIDKISPGKTLPFLKVRYPFGSLIVNGGVLYLPTQQGYAKPYTDQLFPQRIRDLLGYNAVPLGAVLNNSVEVYCEVNDRIFSVAFWNKGIQIGVWEHFDWGTPYSVTAGARSLYMLPKVSLTRGHKRLKRQFSVTLPPPQKTTDCWHIFKQIANSKYFNQPWSCDVIYLTKPWIKRLNDSSHGWNELNSHIDKQGWLHSGYARKKSIIDVLWELFAKSLNDKGLKPSPYVLDTLKHLTFIGAGALPGSQPAIGDDLAGPITELQKVYLDCYGLKRYVPTIMQPAYLDSQRTRPAYYSLQTPTLLETVPNTKNLNTIIDNIRDLAELTEYFLEQVFDDYIKIGKNTANQVIKQLKFEFFHAEPYAYGSIIRPSNEIPNADQAMLSMPSAKKDYVFSNHSAYIHGCVRINALI